AWRTGTSPYVKVCPAATTGTERPTPGRDQSVVSIVTKCRYQTVRPGNRRDAETKQSRGGRTPPAKRTPTEGTSGQSLQRVGRQATPSVWPIRDPPIIPFDPLCRPPRRLAAVVKQFSQERFMS